PASLGGGVRDGATALLDQAPAVDPRAGGLVAARGAVSRAQAATPAGRAATAAKPAPRAAAGPALSTKELELLYRRGMTAMQQGRSDDALRFWEIVWSSDPRYAQVSDYLKREYLTRGMEAFARGQLDEASAFWRRALAGDPTDATAAGLLTAAVLAVGAVSERNTREALTREIETRLFLQAGNLAMAGSEALLSDFPELTLHPLAREMKSLQPELALVEVLDHDRIIQGDPDPRRLGTRYVPGRTLRPIVSHQPQRGGEQLLTDGTLLVASVPVMHRDGR